MNANKARNGEGGSRLVRGKTVSATIGGPNDRTCLLDAILSILPPQVNKSSVEQAVSSAMPPRGDTSVKQVTKALSIHGLYLISVNGLYHRKGGTPIHLLKERLCDLIINIKLTNRENEDMNHFVAWDGDVIHDRPHLCKVNDTSDRTDKGSRKVFDKLYSKRNFHSWQITKVYRLIYSPLPTGNRHQDSLRDHCQRISVQVRDCTCTLTQLDM